MNLTHLHLLMNHAPVLGTIFGLGLLLFSFWRKSEELKNTALGVFVICAILAVPVYITGEPAEGLVKGLPGVSAALMEQHEEAAGVALTSVIVLGVAAIARFLLFRRGKMVPGWFGALMLVGALTVCGMMAWTANLGGQIRHSEIRSNTGQPTLTGSQDKD